MRDRPELLVDPLSDVLSLSSVDGVLSARFEGRGAWSIRFPGYCHLKFGGVLQGAMWLWADDTAVTPVRLQAGDVYLLTSGRPYRSASVHDLPPVDGRAVFRDGLGPDGVVRHGCEGEATVVTGGRFTFADDVSGMLLGLLPPVVHIPATSPAAAPLRATLDLVGFETGADRPGARVVNGALGTLVLVQILRAHLASEDAMPGWLGALADPRIGPVLGLLHGDPARRWSVADMASAAGMARTAFNGRFTAKVGTSPLNYLIRWRMALASAALRTGDQKLADIAVKVGYASESAFSMAFKRLHDESPGHHRIGKQGSKGSLDRGLTIRLALHQTRSAKDDVADTHEADQAAGLPSNEALRCR